MITISSLRHLIENVHWERQEVVVVAAAAVVDSDEEGGVRMRV
jgi:hypothetical protein